jgi:tripartite-type tricarboxylate transporter receptor subunit TctC
MAWRLGLLMAMLWSLPALVQAQADFPTAPVRILVPFAAGGPTDVIQRILAERLAARWGKPVMVENRPGAGTIVATAALAKSPPDGHTLGVATNSFVINPAINHALPYDTLKDFAGVSMVARHPVVLVATQSFAANSVADAVAAARRSAALLDYTSPGPRGVGHMAGELLQSMTGIKMQHVSYGGSAPALTDVIAGRVPLMFDLWHSVKPHVEAGRLKVLAVASAQRLSDAPQYPAIAETYAGFDVSAFQALIAPAGVPPPVLARLSADIRAVLAAPDFRDKMRPFVTEPVGTSPQELDRLLREEIARWEAIARAANIQVE